MGGNWQRRIPVLYTLAEAPASLVNSYVQSVLAILRRGSKANWRPLDHDPDFIYYGSLFGWGGAPDFQPRVQQMCTTDRKLTDRPCSSSSITFKAIAPSAAAFPAWPRRWPAHSWGFTSGRWRRSRRFSSRRIRRRRRRWSSLAQSQIPQLNAKIATLQKFLKRFRRQVGVGPFCRKGRMCNDLLKGQWICERSERNSPSRQEGPTCEQRSPAFETSRSNRRAWADWRGGSRPGPPTA